MAIGVVKWFNPSKGFGFIAPDEGGGDVFVHVSAIEKAGLHGLAEGQRVRYEQQADPRTGKLSAEALELLEGEVPPAQRAPAPQRANVNGAGAIRTPQGSGRGQVKWFNPTKGFGFIVPEDGAEDLFVHISEVEKAGFRSLEEGQTVSYDLEFDSRKGKTAVTNLKIMGRTPDLKPSAGQRTRW
jgi:CspA family cold shock protein